MSTSANEKAGQNGRKIVKSHNPPFSNLNYGKKRDILSEKQESGMALKKREFTPESGNVDTYVME